MNIEQIGWNPAWQSVLQISEWVDHRVARVMSVQKNRTIVHDALQSYEGILAGRLNLLEGPDRIAVGDWVIFNPFEKDQALILDILPRQNVLTRKRPGQAYEQQVMVSNIDWLLVTTALDSDFSISRIERYLTMAYSGGVNPIILLTKADLCHDIDLVRSQLKEIAQEVPVIAVSAYHKTGFDELNTILTPGTTLAIMGSSGVGKSTLVNYLSQNDHCQTAAIRESDGKGRHTTTFRECILLPTGALIIDTPGMREIQPWSDASALAQSFPEISDHAQSCRFRNCSHQEEPGCAVRENVNTDRLFRFKKLERDLGRLKEASTKKGRWETRKKSKALGKLYKSVQNHKRSLKK